MLEANAFQAQEKVWGRYEEQMLMSEAKKFWTTWIEALGVKALLLVNIAGHFCGYPRKFMYCLKANRKSKKQTAGFSLEAVFCTDCKYSKQSAFLLLFRYFVP